MGADQLGRGRPSPRRVGSVAGRSNATGRQGGILATVAASRVWWSRRRQRPVIQPVDGRHPRALSLQGPRAVQRPAKRAQHGRKLPYRSDAAELRHRRAEARSHHQDAGQRGADHVRPHRAVPWQRCHAHGDQSCTRGEEWHQGLAHQWREEVADGHAQGDALVHLRPDPGERR